MNNIKFITDSTCDLSPEIINNYNISIVPLYVNFDKAMYKDMLELSPTELFKKVDETNKLPKTAAPSPNDFYNAFKPYIDNGQDILYVGLSSKISSTINNATLAAAEFPKNRIEIVDSQNLSSGIGILVLKAIDLASQGLSLKEIADKLRLLIPKVKTAFIIDTLDYLHKGGRCSTLQSLASSVLKIKPIISVVDGGMIVREKVRGNRSKGLNNLLTCVLKNVDNIDNSRILVTHSLSDEDSVFLKRELYNKTKAKEILVTNAGCVISSHCGPNTIGIIYMEN